MHWDSLLKQAMEKKSEGVLVARAKELDDDIAQKDRSKYLDHKWYLGIRHGDVYFTGREAEVMSHLLLGRTIASVAKLLKLSPRTIEFYVKNMKTKLSCRTKSELIEKVFNSDFAKNVDFIAALQAP